MALLAVTAAGLLLSISVAIENGLPEGILCLLSTAALVATAIPIVLPRPVGTVEPLWFVLVIVAIGVTGKAFYVCLGPRERVEFLLLGKEPRDLTLAALILASSLFVFSLGYLSGNIRWRFPGLSRLATRNWSSRRHTEVVGTLVALGLISFVVFIMRLDHPFQHLSDFSSKRFLRIPHSRYLGVQGYLRWGVMMIEIAFYLYFTKWAAAKRRSSFLSNMSVLFFAALTLAFPIFVSSRQTVMLLLIRLAVIWVFLRGEPKPRYLAALLALGLILIGSMLAFRRNLSSWEGIREHIGLGEMLEVTVGGRHFLDLTKTAHVIAGVPEVVDYQYGKTMITWLAAPIPRTWWPRKPAIGAGIDLGPVLFHTPKTSGVPPGIVAELYLNFWIPGVFIGMFLLGCLLRSLYETLRPHFSNPSVMLIYTLLVTRISLGLMPGAVSASVVKILQEMIPLALILPFLGAADPDTPRSREPKASCT